MLKSLRQKFGFVKRRFIKPSYPTNGDDKVYLHIGCGEKNHPAFVNVDARPFPHVHVVTSDIAHLGEFADGSADLIYMSHVLEHFKRAEVSGILMEMYRVLKPGGMLRLSVPDFDKLLEVYRLSENDVLSIHNQLMGGQDNPYNIHYTAFNRRDLDALLLATGFSKVQLWDPWVRHEPHIKDSSMKVMRAGGKEVRISINVEAIK
jgi:SAM-dependent methyltransferase